MFVRFLLLLTLLLPLGACSKREKSTPQKPTVLVSVAPYAYFVHKIAQDTVHVESLIPPGANPHIHESTPKAVQSHQNAALWVYLGETFDKKVLQFFRESGSRIQILDVAQGIELLTSCEGEHSHCDHSHEGGEDLHIWLSPSLARGQVIRIADALTTLLPEHKELFAANLKDLLRELEALEGQIAGLLRPLKGSAILVSHPAFAYLCREYGLVQLSVEVEGKDPLPQHVTELLVRAREQRVRSVLTEPQHSNKGAELIAASLDLPVHRVDPYAENYSENLLKIAQVIAE